MSGRAPDTALAFDLETVCLDSSMAIPYPEADRSPPANYKADDAIAKWRESDKKAWETDRLKQYSLHPLLGRIVAVGLADADGRWDHIARTEADEARIVDKLWTRIAAAFPVVTWNGLGFDLPFLLTRSMVLGVSLPSGVRAGDLLKRYSTIPHCDVKAVVCQWDNQKMRSAGNSLDDWAVALGLGAKLAHGSAVYEMHRAGKHADIGLYAADDAAKTLALYHKVHPYFVA